MNPTIRFCDDVGETSYYEASAPETRERPLSHFTDAIADFFVEFPRWMDIRPLWRQNRTRFFRVNFWRVNPAAREERIARSVFVAVDETFGGLRVRAAG